MITIAGIAALGAVGACARYLVDREVTHRVRGHVPWGTFVVNATGAFLLGLITGLALDHQLGGTTQDLLGTGFCGAFTTFSTFAFESRRLAADGRRPMALVNVMASTVIGLALAGGGLALADVWR